MNKWIDKYLHVKIYWGTISGHLSLPLAIFDKVLMIGVFLKVFGITNYWAVAIGCSAIVILLLFIAKALYSKGIVTMENSINNRYNKEFMAVYNKLNEP